MNAYESGQQIVLAIGMALYFLLLYGVPLCMLLTDRPSNWAGGENADTTAAS
jgi:hypothetical protein